MASNHYYHITWDEFMEDAKLLAARVQDKGPFHGVVAVTRGGLVPAAIVARSLGVKLIDTVCLASYGTDDQQQSIEIVKSMQSDENWLVIDDLVDTGLTFIEVQKMLPQATLAAVYAKPEGLPKTHAYAKEVPQSTWLVFPWEE